MTHDYTLPKSCKLKSKKIIDHVFMHGREQFVYPFKLKFSESSDINGIKFGVSVPKRKVKKAVSRNRIKRQTREAYRLHQDIISQEIDSNPGFAMMFIYIENKFVEYSLIEKSIKKHLKRLNKYLDQIEESVNDRHA